MNECAFHHNETKHGINWDETKIVTQSNNKYVLRFKEALAINSCQNMNQDKGLEIPKIWLETLTERDNKNSWNKLKTIQPEENKKVTVGNNKRMAVGNNRETTGNRNKEMAVGQKQVTMGIRRSERIKAKEKK
jgi:hypothetical protein